MDAITLSGKANNGTPRQDFADHIAQLPDDEFVEAAENKIWLSAYAGNNPRSDYHWQADACYDEAKRRGNEALYERAYKRACASAGVEA